jgi:hypothetical protein
MLQKLKLQLLQEEVQGEQISNLAVAVEDKFFTIQVSQSLELIQ